MNLWVKLHDPTLKLTNTDPLTPMLCPLAVLMLTLLSEILCNNPSAEAVSYLMQLTCAPVSWVEMAVEGLKHLVRLASFCHLLWSHLVHFGGPLVCTLLVPAH